MDFIERRASLEGQALRAPSYSTKQLPQSLQTKRSVYLNSLEFKLLLIDERDRKSCQLIVVKKITYADLNCGRLPSNRLHSDRLLLSGCQVNDLISHTVCATKFSE